MVVAREVHKLVASGHGPSNSDCSHDSFGSGIAKGDTLVTGQFADQGCDLSGERSLRPDCNTAVELVANCVDHELRRVPKHNATIAVHNVDVLIAIHIPKP